ncbi:hypothetical protein BH11MYX2_BH11MYX2_34960 [soil metagenome]
MNVIVGFAITFAAASVKSQLLDRRAARCPCRAPAHVDGVNLGQATTGWGGYLGSAGSRHIRNVEPLPLSTRRTCAQPWQIELGNVLDRSVTVSLYQP